KNASFFREMATMCRSPAGCRGSRHDCIQYQIRRGGTFSTGSQFRGPLERGAPPENFGLVLAKGGGSFRGHFLLIVISQIIHVFGHAAAHGRRQLALSVRRVPLSSM